MNSFIISQKLSPMFFTTAQEVGQNSLIIIPNVCLKINFMGFPGGAVVKNPPARAGVTDSSPGPGRSHVPQSN